MKHKKLPPSCFNTWEEYIEARNNFYKSPEWLNIRQKVIEKSDGKCVYCGCYPTKDNPINIDHRIPLWKSWGLRLNIKNLQLTCHRCNMKKAGQSHLEMLHIIGIIKKPEKKKKSKQEKRREKQLRLKKKEEANRKRNAVFWAEYLK